MIDTQTFFNLQKQLLVNEFKNNMATCLIATTPERLYSHAQEYGWEIHGLQGSKISSALVIQKNNNSPELWVAKKYTRYRKAFVQFMHDFFCVREPLSSRSWQVDHLLSRHRFKTEHPDYFIRLYLTQRKINTSFGAGFEKQFFSKEREKIPSGGFHMDWITFLKAYGIKLPGKKPGAKHWSVWAWKLATQLSNENIEDKVIAYAGISTVLNLGYTGKFSPLPLHESFKAEALSHPTIGFIPALRE